MAGSAAICDFGWKARDFSLRGTDGKTYTLADVRGRNGTLVVFICNHCPYVKAVIDRLVADAKVLMAEGIGVAGVCSNDARTHPEDSFEKMKAFAAQHGFPFPYLHDESQSVARAYGAVCTPDFSGHLNEARRPTSHSPLLIFFAYSSRICTASCVTAAPCWVAKKSLSSPSCASSIPYL